MQLYHRKYGSGKPLLILHGLLGSSGNWHSLARSVFGRSWTTYTLDLRNHGRSPHATETTYAAMAGDVLEFARNLRAGDVHVLGHSMGGKVAMQLAISYPQLVDRLVVIDVAPRAFDDDRPAVIRALRSVDLDQHASRTSIDRALSDQIGPEDIRQFLLKNLGRVDGRFVWQPNLDALERGYRAIAGPVTAKGIFAGDTLFVRGGRSDYIRSADVDDIQRRFPSAHIATIPAAGHWVHVDAPDELGRLVTRFLAAPHPATTSR